MEVISMSEIFAIIVSLVFFVVYWILTKRRNPIEISIKSCTPFSFSGMNTRNKAQKWLIEDMEFAKEKVVIVTGTGRDEFWNESNVVKAIRDAKNRGVKVTFIIGPHFYEAYNDSNPIKRNIGIRNLASKKVIELRTLKKHACAGLRLVDNNGTYTCYHESTHPTQDRRPYLRTWNNEQIAQKLIKLIEKYLKESEIVPEEDLFPKERNAA